MLTMAIPDVEFLAVQLFTVSVLYSPDGINVYGSRRGEFEEIGSLWGLKVVQEGCAVAKITVRCALYKQAYTVLGYSFSSREIFTTIL